MRLHIGLFGRRNVGKSSLLNAITRQEVSIVSDQAGTTTDPVEKPMELLPLGPVLFIDTAGIDDVGALGELRAARTLQVFERTDLGVLVADGRRVGRLRGHDPRGVRRARDPHRGRVQQDRPGDAAVGAARRGCARRGAQVVRTAASLGRGVLDFRQALLAAAPADFVDNPTILGDLVGPGELAVLVVPIDKEAPRGRLILPQVQAIRDLMDADAMALVVKERELREALARLTPSAEARGHRLPGLPQGGRRHAARRAHDELLHPLRALQGRPHLAGRRRPGASKSLRSGDRMLIAEHCSHHPIGEDIGRVKIPRWLTQYVGGKLEVEHVQGHDFPDPTPSPTTSLVIHCGACTANRREMLTRIVRCREAGVPITNYGLAIAYSLGIFERALQPFPGRPRSHAQGRTHGLPSLAPAATAAAVGDEPVDDL